MFLIKKSFGQAIMSYIKTNTTLNVVGEPHY